MPVLHHVVLWTFADAPDKAERIREARRLLAGCAALVPGTLRFEVGAAQDGLEHTADLVLLSTFVDRAALDAYQAHPEHTPVKDRIRAWVRAREVLDFWGE